MAVYLAAYSVELTVVLKVAALVESTGCERVEWSVDQMEEEQSVEQKAEMSAV